MKSIPLALPDLGPKEAEAAGKTILSGWVTQGPCVKEFEKNFARYTGANHACAVSNCTVALHYALLAVGVRPGDTVITVSHSFIATANAVRHCNAEPVFVDIDPNTLNMDIQDLNRVLSNDYENKAGRLFYKDIQRLVKGESPLATVRDPLGRLGAILLVHQTGIPMDMNNFLSITKPLNIPVVEDAACAIGSEVLIDDVWQPIGRPVADIACFSFHPRKVITTGDGGMITTNIDKHDLLFRLLRQHGMGISDVARHNADSIIFEDYLINGFNGRMTDIQAAIGIEQLKKLPSIIQRRREIAAIYHKRFNGLPGIRLIHEPEYARSNWQSYMIFLDDPSLQKPFMQRLMERGISTRRGIMCAHLEAPYFGNVTGRTLRNSENARDTGIILPLYPGMSNADVERVAREVEKNCWFYTF